ncbi:hypothetical protein HY384_02735 [Candidatus Daviesbacteria bacterium]|nr:hypothetical protein [Candidatus Daviesbacteria bacterium]MBI4038852.1 hypothetical protein [Candidatus Daviesbacteria bacterium]
MTEIKIQIVDYNLFEYEKNFLAKEIKRWGGIVKEGKIERNSTLIVKGLSLEKAKRLTYIKSVFYRSIFYPSLQSIRESFNGKSARTQSRRYGPHGLHEYKGRFNPQMPRSLMLANFNSTAIVLDPFMGSGTTMVEARDLGYNAIGVELNPFACLLAKAKKIYEEIPALGEIRWSSNSKSENFFDSETKDYLLKWFPRKQFNQLEFIQRHLVQLDSNQRIIAQVVMSNLLRDHSLQNPKDLRIRRRDTVPIDFDLLDTFKTTFKEISIKHAEWIKEFSIKKRKDTQLFNADSRNLKDIIKIKVNGSVSSPPYATALPYVDTYRLSMVALGLIHPKEILKREKELIGSRDVTIADKTSFGKHVSILPSTVQEVINYIYEEINKDSEAGFRKKAAPYAFARYCVSMLRVLEELYSIEKIGSKNFWVLGPNRIKLRSNWFTMETPELVGELAKKVGFKKVSIEPVQAYNRYDMHSKNSISKESILVFQR